VDLSTKGIKGSTIRVKLAPVELFVDMNRITYFKRILHKIIPRDGGVLGGSEPFTTTEIKRMLESTKKLRTKAFVHFLASTGIRPGAIIDPILRRKRMNWGCEEYVTWQYKDEKTWMAA
jgi:integrase/recombinase XerD